MHTLHSKDYYLSERGTVEFCLPFRTHLMFDLTLVNHHIENDNRFVVDTVRRNLLFCKATIFVLGTEWYTIGKANDSIRQSTIIG